MSDFFHRPIEHKPCEPPSVRRAPVRSLRNEMSLTARAAGAIAGIVGLGKRRCGVGSVSLRGDNVWRAKAQRGIWNCQSIFPVAR